jgi:hypothetical protein
LRGRGRGSVGFIDEKTRAIFGRSYAAEPHVFIEQLKKDEAIAEAGARASLRRRRAQLG